MKKTRNCKRCEKKIYPNQLHCSECSEVILFGSKEKATKAKIQGFKNLGLC